MRPAHDRQFHGDRSGITGISFTIVFRATNIPEWVNQYVDIGAILVNGVNVAYFNPTRTRPLGVIGSTWRPTLLHRQRHNSAGRCRSDDGVSAPSPSTPVHLGVNTLKIAIADTRDHICDSGLFISNMGPPICRCRGDARRPRVAR